MLGDVEIVFMLLLFYYIYLLMVNVFIFMGFGGCNILIVNLCDMKMVMKIICYEMFMGIIGINMLYNVFFDNEEFCKCDFLKFKFVMVGGMVM